MPKLHKYNRQQLIDNNFVNEPLKARPICTYHSFILNKLSIWISYQLNQVIKLAKKKVLTVENQTIDITPSKIIVNNTDTIIKDIEKLKTNSDDIIISLDVVSLYPNINSDEGIECINKFLHAFNDNQLNTIEINLIIKGLRLILNNSYCKFNDTIYKQKHGSTMGCPCIPSYANIFSYYQLLHIITNLMKTNHTIKLLGIYIDDYIIITTIPTLILETHTYLNNYYDALMKRLTKSLTIQFTWETSKHSLHYLDINIYNDVKYIHYYVSLYVKPLNNHMLLSNKSYHTPSVFKGIIIGHFIRLIKRNSHYEDFINHLNEFQLHLAVRQYNLTITKLTNLIQSKWNNFNYNNYNTIRDTLLTKSLEEKDETQFVNVILTNYGKNFNKLIHQQLQGQLCKSIEESINHKIRLINKNCHNIGEIFIRASS